MNARIVVSDLGRMKVYGISRDELEPGASPAFEDVADVDLVNQHSRVSDRMADKAGRFSYGPGSKDVGERHHEQDEAESQQLGSIAAAISEATGSQHDVFLAAPKEIVSNLVAALDSKVSARIVKTLPLNLVKAPKLELLKRLEIQ